MKMDKSKKILIVDDDKANLMLMSLLLEDSNNIETACNGEEGLRKIQKENYDLIISDINMPAMSGIEMFLELEKSDPSIQNRFLFFSATNDHREIAFIRERCLYHLEKPSPVGKIRSMISNIVDNEVAVNI